LITLITGRWGRVIYDVHGSSVERSATARGIAAAGGHSDIFRLSFLILRLFLIRFGFSSFSILFDFSLKISRLRSAHHHYEYSSGDISGAY